MPEGHSIHRIARQISDVFTGERVQVSSPQGRYAEGAALLDGHTITGAYAHGKHLFVTFENDLTLNVHLGIYGNWSFGGDETFTGASSIGAPRKIGEKEYAAGEGEPYAGPPEPKSTVRCRIVSEHGWADLVGPTICRTLTPEEVRTVRSKLGPDPLNPDADPEQFYRAARKSSRPIGVILMDQAAISGVGNIFRAESLYRQEIDPLRPGKSLSDDELKRHHHPHGRNRRTQALLVPRLPEVATGGEEQWLRLYWWWMFRGVFCIRSYRLEIMTVRKRRCRRLWRISAVQGAK